MAQLGIGLGAFIGGISNGLKLGEAIDARSRERSLYQAQAEAGKEAGTAYDAAVQGKIQSVGGVGPDGPTQSFAVGGQNYPTQEAAQSAAKQQMPFYSFYMQNYAPTVARKAIEIGRPDLAQGFMKYMSDDRTAQATEQIGRAHNAFALGDKEGALRMLAGAANNPAISGGGVHYDFDPINNDKGELTGYRVSSVDGTGKRQTKDFGSADELWRAAFPLVSPEAAYKTGLEREKAADAARTKRAEKTFESALKQGEDANRIGLETGKDVTVNREKGIVQKDVDTNKLGLEKDKDIAVEGAKAENAQDREITKGMFAVQAALARSGATATTQARIAKDVHARLQADGGIGAYSKLSPEQQIELSAKSIAAQNKAASTLDTGAPASGRGGPSVPAQRQTQPAARAPGQTAPGNIDLHNRPRVRNADGSISTVRSMSFNDNGREVLVPTVSDDGRILSEEDAIKLYRQTGKHLGMFDSPAAATAYAKQLHNEQEAEYVPKSGRATPPVLR